MKPVLLSVLPAIAAVVLMLPGELPPQASDTATINAVEAVEVIPSDVLEILSDLPTPSLLPTPPTPTPTGLPTPLPTNPPTVLPTPTDTPGEVPTPDVWVTPKPNVRTTEIVTERVTVPGPTVTVTGPERPGPTVTETVTEPGPTITVTETESETDSKFIDRIVRRIPFWVWILTGAGVGITIVSLHSMHRGRLRMAEILEEVLDRLRYLRKR